MNSPDDSSIVVLLVEDCESDAELARRALRLASTIEEIHVIEDGREALTFLRQEGDYTTAPRPDIVLLDMELPGMHGIEVLGEMRADDELNDLPVVVFSTSDDPAFIASAYDYDAVAYMTKPISFRRFNQLIVDLNVGSFAVIRSSVEA